MIGKDWFFIMQSLFFTTPAFTLNQIPSSLNSSALAPDLYCGFKQVKELKNVKIFIEEVFERDRHKLWLIEGYADWCGDCKRFVPTIKQLEYDISGWRDWVGIGVIDCNDPISIELCQHLDVSKYPTLKIFTPNSWKMSQGSKFGDEGDVTRVQIRERLAEVLKMYQNKVSVDGVVNLKLFSGCHVERLWETFPPEVKFLVLVMEGRDSLVGSQLALDISTTREVRVRLVDPDNTFVYRLFGVERGYNGAVILDRDSTSQQSNICVTHLTYIPVDVPNFTRETLNDVVRRKLRNLGVKISLHLPHIPLIYHNVTQADLYKAAIRENILKIALQVKYLATVVFQMDLEAAIEGIFLQEIPVVKNIAGEKLNSLKTFVTVVSKYFPSVNERGKHFFEALKNEILHKDSLQGEDVQQLFIHLVKKYDPFIPKTEWVGCRGTTFDFRGFPCTVWTMFHTLVALEELHNRHIPGGKPEVLYAMASYIKNFFRCKSCAHHFTKLADTIPVYVMTRRDSVLWLWRAHNKVNRRLAGAGENRTDYLDKSSEDPRHPKIQFPTHSECPACYLSDGSWNEPQVFTFLSHMYTKPSHLDPHTLPGYPSIDP